MGQDLVEYFFGDIITYAATMEFIIVREQSIPKINCLASNPRKEVVRRPWIFDSVKMGVFGPTHDIRHRLLTI